MNLIKWDSFKDLEDISNNLNRWLGRSANQHATNISVLAEADWKPLVDISETDKAYLIKADIPGVSKEDVKVTVQDGTLIIRGERRQEKEEQDKTFHRVERSYGSFMRSFHLPDDSDASGVTAEFKDGILNVSVKKSATAKPKAIEVAVS